MHDNDKPVTHETLVTALVEETDTQETSPDDSLVVIYSKDTKLFGQRYVLAHSQLTFGRGTDNSVPLDDEIVSRNHCQMERVNHGWVLTDLGSTNGTYVNDEMIETMRLRPNDQIKVGGTIFKFLSGSDVEAQYHETIYRMTIMDGLTGAHNARFLFDTLEREIARARRHARPLTIAMLDVDFFKNVNDGFGHLAGDALLKELVTKTSAGLRPDDFLARYGGEEFAILFPETTLQEAASIAETIRKAIETHTFHFEVQDIRITVSIGIATYDQDANAQAFIKRADTKLYEAKNSGRNKTCS